MSTGKLAELDSTNFAQELTPLTAEEQIAFRAYRVDGNGAHVRLRNVFTAAADPVVRLCSHGRRGATPPALGAFNMYGKEGPGPSDAGKGTHVGKDKDAARNSTERKKSAGRSSRDVQGLRKSANPQWLDVRGAALDAREVPPADTRTEDLRPAGQPRSFEPGSTLSSLSPAPSARPSGQATRRGLGPSDADYEPMIQEVNVDPDVEGLESDGPDGAGNFTPQNLDKDEKMSDVSDFLSGLSELSVDLLEEEEELMPAHSAV